MYCSANKDQPLRLRFTPKGVVHAGSYQDYGGFTRYLYKPSLSGTGQQTEYVPKQKVVRIACRWKDPKPDMENYIISNQTQITCKACMLRMDMVEGPVSPKRFVVRNTETGEFLKNTTSRCSGWSDSLSDAFFFRTEHTAKSQCKVIRYRAGNKLMTYVEWAKAGRPKVKYERTYDPCLEVKSVRITLE